MRAFLIFISIQFTFQTFSQVELSSRFEILASDSFATRTAQSHTSLKPLIRQANSLQNGKFAFNALSDINYIQNTRAEHKMGAGTSFKGLFWNKLCLDLNVIGGQYQTDSIFRPNIYMRNNDTTNGIYFDVRSRISFTPNKFFNFQVGLDNNFVGEGCRSLLLGDYGVANPFALIRANFWRFEYSVLYQFLRERNNNQWESKFNASHHISVNATKWLNFGIFETVVFQPKDTLLNRGFDVEYLNPMIFYRPQEYSLGSADNVLLGAEMSLFYRKHCFYGQFILDEFFLEELKARSGWWANKFGGQMGIKGQFELGKQHFFYRAEYNFVRPFTYSHISEELNYGNQGESMAHPYHSNFMELLGELKWNYGKWNVKLFVNYYVRGGDKDGASYGGNMYQSYTNRPYDLGNYIGQGIQENGSVGSLFISYSLLKHGNMNLFVDAQVRSNALTGTKVFLIAGIRSFLWNDYRNY